MNDGYIKQVATLYDSLFRLENKWRGGVYPIHKKMNLPAKYDCLYDFVLEHVSPVTSQELILDAGCGVGFGTQHIARKSGAKVTGYSISPLEVSRAAEASKNMEKGQCVFENKGFHEVEPSTFDLIICVESLKHAEDINRDIDVLVKGLRPNGRLVIVDDFYYKGQESREAKDLKRQWHLADLIKERHFGLMLKQDSIVSLVPFIIPKNGVKLKLKLFAYRFLSLFGEKNWLKLAAGGTNLDLLYSRGEMKYLMITVKKKGISSNSNEV